jgi:hypothetical protein
VGGDRRDHRPPHHGAPREGANPGRPGQPGEWPHEHRGCAVDLHRVPRRVVVEEQHAHSHSSPENPPGSAPVFSRIGRTACGQVSAAAAWPCTSTATCAR